MEDKPITAKDDLQEIPEPIGKWIIENMKDIPTQFGAVYHYSEVCKGLKAHTAPLLVEIESLKKEVERLMQTERIHALNYAIQLYSGQDQYIHIAKKAFMAGENNAFYVLRKENRLKF